MKKFIIFVLLMVGLLATSPVFAAENTSSPPSSSMNEPESSMSGSQGQGALQVIHADDLIGKTVKNKQGEALGKVEDLAIGKDGSVDFVVLSYGGTFGIGAKYVPVPFKTFMSNAIDIGKISTDKDLVADLDKAKFDAAPSFSDKNWDVSSKSAQDICNYYGAAACPPRG